MSEQAPNTYRSFGAQAFHYFDRDHAKIPDAPVESAAAWHAPSLSPESWRVEFSATALGELEAAIARLEELRTPLESIRGSSVPVLTLSREVDACRRRLTDGCGFLVVSGLPVHEWGEARSALAFWLLGHQMGLPGAQNPSNELLGHVIDYGEQETSPHVRLYRTRSTIGFHCDAADVVGLLCLEPAVSGGKSRIASSVAIWNRLFAEHPESARLLFEPWALDRRDEHPPDQPGHLDLAPCRFGHDEKLRTFYHSEYFRSAARLDAVGPLPADRIRTLDRFDAIGHSDEFLFEIEFERGDLQFLSNHSIVHARSGYTDSPERRRHLLRLWLSLENGR